MKLTDTKIRAIRPPKSGRRKVSDGHGLVLLVSFTGGMVWYQRKLDSSGKERMIHIGPYPAVGLAEARRLGEEIRTRMDRGLPPREEVRPVLRFDALAAEWLDLQRAKLNPAYVRDLEQRLQRHILPFLGERPITEIRPMEVLEVLRRIVDSGAVETAHRLRRAVSSIFCLAVVTERAEADPAAPLKGALPSPKRGHMPARIKPDEARTMYRVCSTYTGQGHSVRHALLFLALTAARPGMVNKAEWCEIDLERRRWTVPAEKMKSGREARIPLSAQAVAVLRMQEAVTRGSQYVFKGRTLDRPLSENTLRSALRSLGIYDHVPHGWRSTFSTVANELGIAKPDVIEAALEHAVGGKVRAAYMRAEFWEQKAQLMEWWGEFLTKGSS